MVVVIVIDDENRENEATFHGSRENHTGCGKFLVSMRVVYCVSD
jgi:hypothetical protein